MKNDKLKIAIYVHDLFLEIGHSRALIESINNLPENSIEEISVISFSTDNLSRLFPNHNCPKIKYTPFFSKIYPFIFKMIFFYIYAFYISSFVLPKGYKRIGIGIAYPFVDIFNIQFIHKHWGEFYFKINKIGIIKRIYKKILFAAFSFFENIAYSQKGVKFSVLSSFCKDYLCENFSIKETNAIVNYSGINLSEFCINNFEKDQNYKSILKLYPQFENLDLKRPVYLFVGAYERKGLRLILNKMKHIGKDFQLVIVGEPESISDISFPVNVKPFRVQKTENLNLFYEISDAFLFPSIYEPFGLVIIEAVAMGLHVFTVQKNIGASEILNDLDEVTIYKSIEDFKIADVKIQTKYDKMALREKRLERLGKYTWDKTADKIYKLLTNL